MASTTIDTRKGKHSQEDQICLISMPCPFAHEPAMNPPLGLAYLSATLKKNNFTHLTVLDYALYNYDYNHQTDYLYEIPTQQDVYLIYGLSSQFYWLKQTVQYIRNRNPEALVIVGGPHASTCPQECLNIGADIAVRGEGEQPVLDLLHNKPWNDIEGVCFYDHDHKFHANARAYVRNLDTLPIPDRNIFGLDNYQRCIGGEKAVHLVTLRGCPYQCAFCDKESVGCNTRYRSVSHTLHEIDTLIEQHNIRSFVIYDDIFTLNPERTLAFCRAFSKRNIQWRCWSRVDKLNKKILMAMKQSGLTSITLGVESGDDRILKNIHKSATATQNLNALRLCKDLEIPVRCSLMYGNPGENTESVNNTLRMIQIAQPDEWNLAILSPVPGSDIWNHPEKYGVILDKNSVREQDYRIINRFGNSGIGNVYIDLTHLKPGEFITNLEYMVKQLEQICPRRKIQDTIQSIKVSNLSQSPHHNSLMDKNKNVLTAPRDQ